MVSCLSSRCLKPPAYRQGLGVFCRCRYHDPEPVYFLQAYAWTDIKRFFQSHAREFTEQMITALSETQKRRGLKALRKHRILACRKVQARGASGGKEGEEAQDAG